MQRIILCTFLKRGFLGSGGLFLVVGGGVLFVFLCLFVCFGLSTLNMGLKRITLTSRVPRSSDWASWVSLIFLYFLTIHSGIFYHFVLSHSTPWFGSWRDRLHSGHGQLCLSTTPHEKELEPTGEIVDFQVWGRKLSEEHVGPLFVPDSTKAVRVNQGPMTCTQKTNLR